MSGRKAKKVQQPEEEEDIEEIATAGAENADARAMLASDPRLLAGLQAQLMGLIGRGSGLYDSLPQVVKTRVKALKKLQHAHVKMELEFHRQVALLEQEYARKFAELYGKRKDIISGAHEPSAEEADWVDEEEEEAKEEKEGDKNEKKDEGDKNVKGIPKFWLTALQNNDFIAEMIQEHDVAILESLEDITLELSAEPNTGFKLHFHFAPNEFFTNKVLTKEYVLDPNPESEKDLIYDGPVLKNTVGTNIDWKKGKDVTVKTIRKKQKKKGGAGAGQTRTIVKTVPQESFFRFFAPLDMGDETDPDEMDQSSGHQVQRDYEVGEILKERVIPSAVLWFTGEALDYEDFNMGEDGYGEEEMGEEEGEEEDPDYKPPARNAEQPPECKQS